MSWNDNKTIQAGGGKLGGVSGVVTASVYTLPAGGYNVGDVRVENGITYRLCYNNGNNQVVPGYLMSAIPCLLAASSTGPYSMTVTTTSQSANEIAACVVHNATVPTGCYFWGATKGLLASGMVCSSVTLLTSKRIYVGSSGSVDGVSVASGFTSGNIAKQDFAICVVSATAGTVAVRQGQVYINLE